jgi:hypothetical protein
VDIIHKNPITLKNLLILSSLVVFLKTSLHGKLRNHFFRIKESCLLNSNFPDYKKGFAWLIFKITGKGLIYPQTMFVPIESPSIDCPN